MKNYYSTSIAKSLKKQGLPKLRIKLLRTLCFDVLIDTSIKHNLIDPNFIYFEVDEDFYTCFDECSSGIIKPKMHLFKDSFKKLGTQEIIGWDGNKKPVDELNFNFEFKGEKHSDSYLVVEFSHTKYSIPNRNVDVILGVDFLKKYNWIIDYKKKVIYSPKKH